MWVFQRAEIALAEEARAISAFWGTHSCKLIPDWTRNRMITYTYRDAISILVSLRKLFWLCGKPVCFAGTLFCTCLACLRLYCTLLGIFNSSWHVSKLELKVVYRFIFYIYPETSFHDGDLSRPTIEIHLLSGSCSVLRELYLKLNALMFRRSWYSQVCYLFCLCFRVGFIENWIHQW